MELLVLILVVGYWLVSILVVEVVEDIQRARRRRKSVREIERHNAEIERGPLPLDRELLLYLHPVYDLSWFERWDKFVELEECLVAKRYWDEVYCRAEMFTCGGIVTPEQWERKLAKDRELESKRQKEEAKALEKKREEAKAAVERAREYARKEPRDVVQQSYEELAEDYKEKGKPVPKWLAEELPKGYPLDPYESDLVVPTVVVTEDKDLRHLERKVGDLHSKLADDWDWLCSQRDKVVSHSEYEVYKLRKDAFERRKEYLWRLQDQIGQERAVFSYTSPMKRSRYRNFNTYKPLVPPPEPLRYD